MRRLSWPSFPTLKFFGTPKDIPHEQLLDALGLMTLKMIRKRDRRRETEARKQKDEVRNPHCSEEQELRDPPSA